ncbi:MAG TPA: FtsQ-type POTRA domain-containing protein [Actinobacteria bacterium]|nr:FtsQ-type POTRA domain-containing protein [Actinomycetota bacterium]
MPHVEEARKRRNEKLRRTRTKQTLYILAIIVIACAVIIGGYLVWNSDYWLIKKVTVAGNKRVSAEEVVALTELDADTSLLKLPKERTKAKLERHPWIKQAHLDRNLPDQLLITIKEREPFVIIKQSDKLIVLDETGFVLQSKARTGESGIPVINGVKIVKPKIGKQYRNKRVQAVLKSLRGLDKDLREKVTWVSVSSLENLSFQTSDGLEVIYGGPKDAVKKNFLIKKILQEADERIIHINVTAPDNPVVRKLDR